MFVYYHCICSKYNFHEEPAVKTLKLQKLRSLRNHNGIDRALFSFDLDAGKSKQRKFFDKIYMLNVLDFTPCFHWNIFQINAFVVAEYETKKNVICVAMLLIGSISMHYYTENESNSVVGSYYKAKRRGPYCVRR